MNAFSAESLAAALAIIGIVIIVSALLSGLIERSGLPKDGGASASSQLGGDGDIAQVGPQRISLDELRRLWRAKEPVTILDARTERSFEEDDFQAMGAVRMPPDHVAERARELGLNQEVWLVAFCA